MLTKALKLAYMQSFIVNNTFAQIKSRLGPKATILFVNASKIFEELTAAFGNVNQKQKACIEYRSLRQRTRDFSTFWTKF